MRTKQMAIAMLLGVGLCNASHGQQTVPDDETYSLAVLYHPAAEIGNAENIDGLMCFTSVPIELIVEPIKITTAAAEQAKVAELVLRIPNSGVVQVVEGRYDKNLDQFMPKDSPAGQLKEMSWKAVPELIKAVNGNMLNPTQRASALGLLYVITNRHDPIVDNLDNFGVLGHYEFRSSDPAMASYRRKEGWISMADLSIDESAQRAFAKQWNLWLDKGSVQVVKTDAEK